MKKRILSLLLAGGMILTLLTLPGQPASTAEAAPADSLVAHYDFEGDFEDSVNAGTRGTAVGNNSPTIVDDAERGQVMDATGGTSSGMIRTENPLYGEADLEGLTVSAWIKADAVGEYAGLWSFSGGNSVTDGYFGQASNGRLYYNLNAQTPDFDDMTEFDKKISTDDGWTLITVVMDQTHVYMYENGKLSGSLQSITSLGNSTSSMLDFIADTPYLWFGTASPYYHTAAGWGSGDFQMDDFKVYSEALTADDVLDEYLADSYAAKEIIADDIARLSVPPTTRVNLTLPDVGNSTYSTISWNSSDPDVIATDGTVTRPVSGIAEVTLTATVTVGNESDSKTFTVTVPAADASGDIQIYAEQLTLNAGFVTSDLTLPTSIEAAAVTWKSDRPDVITDSGVVTRPSENTDVTLTATLMLEDTDNVEKDFKVTVIAKGGNVATYVSNDPGLDTDALRGQIGGMMIAAEDEEGTYNVLHKEQPIMYTAQGTKAYVSPQIFRKADGTFGMIAADGGNNNRVFLYNSENLITYTHETAVALDGISNISKLYMLYDMTDTEYRLYVENNAGTVFLLTSKDLSDFSAPEQTEFVIPTVENAPEYATWASEIGLTQEEYDAVTAKFTNPYNTEAEYIRPTEVTVKKDATTEEIKEALNEAANGGGVTATYSDGTTKEYSIRWDSDDLAKIDTSREGVEYSVTGVVGGSAYFTDAEDPLIEERADPCITYDEDRQKYYFTASYPVNGKAGEDGYDRLVIREADTIEGLADAQEIEIWNESSVQGYGQFIWALELHKIGNYWYFISTAATNEDGYSFDIRPFMMRCKDAEKITDPDSWELVGRVTPMEGDGG